MPDEPGYVSVDDIREGDSLSKSDLNNTKDSWKDVAGEVGELNLREEGLDRRVFEYDSTWNDFLNSNSRCYLSQTRSVSMPGQAWEGMSIGGVGPEKIVGGIGESSPIISFLWHPQQHTYVIIRASFWFRFDVGLVGRARNSGSTDWVDALEPLRQNIDVQFGIQVTTPGGVITDGMAIHRFDNIPGKIFCPTQLGLSRQYAERCTHTFGMIEHEFDRRTAMASSVTMVVGGQSWTNEDQPLTNNNHAIDLRTEGQVKARLVWRCRQDPSTLVCNITDSDFEGERVHPEVGALQFFAQVFKR
jgi:hypothetical protein